MQRGPKKSCCCWRLRCVTEAIFYPLSVLFWVPPPPPPTTQPSCLTRQNLLLDSNMEEEEWHRLWYYSIPTNHRTKQQKLEAFSLYVVVNLKLGWDRKRQRQQQQQPYFLTLLQYSLRIFFFFPQQLHYF